MVGLCEWRWYVIGEKVSGLWVGEDEVRKLRIRGRCSGGACIWGKCRMSCDGM